MFPLKSFSMHWCNPAIIVFLLLASLNLGCSIAVIPPANPVKPTVIYLCDYGVHSSVLMPVSDHQFVEYLYGDWNWAALNHTGWLDAVGAMLWSGQATLGQRYISQRRGQPMPIPPGGPLSEIPIVVNGDGCAQAVSEMEKRWLAQDATALTVAAPYEDFWYVKDAQHYSWWHDCNLSTAELLKEMGCEVKGHAIRSNFVVKPAASR